MAEVDLEGGLLRLLAGACARAVMVRDVQLAAGNPAIGESMLAAYLAEGVEWAARYRAWREAQCQPAETPEAILARYLAGD